MQLTKLRHSCVRVETGTGVLVLDPGVISEAAESLSGADEGIDILGTQRVEGHVARVADRYGSVFTHLSAGESHEL